MRVKTLAGIVLCACAPAMAPGGEIQFATKPAATKAGDPATGSGPGGVKISFAASAPTDVEVAVLDAQGKVVRHLAAGVIGGKDAPPPPLKAGLSQSLEWDSRDDTGKAAAGGPFKVRVRLGMKPEFDGFLLDVPAATGAVTDVAVGPKGELYLWHRDNTANGNQGSNKLKVIGRDGKYLRTLLPYPASLPKEKAKVLGAMTDDDGNLVPRVYNLQQLALTDRGYTARGRTMSSSGCVDAKGRVYWLMADARLAAIEADGAPVYDQFLSKSLFPDFPAVAGWGSLAVSGDGKYLYMVGLAKAKNKYDKAAATASCVWRVDLATLKTESFIGDPEKPGKDGTQLAAPCAVAAAKGLIYVADRGADRVAVFREADKSPAGEIKVQAPASVGADPATGAIYVVARTGKKTADLLKFAGPSGGEPVARLALPESFNAHRIAVDASAKPVRLVLPTLRWQGGEITCIEDAGGKLEGKGDPRDLKAPWGEGPRDLTVDRSRGELYVKFGTQKYYRLDAKTGKVLARIDLRNVAGNLDSAGTQLVVSPDGSLVTHSWGHGLKRLDRDGKPLNWPGRDTNSIPYGGIMTFQERYLVMPRADEIFIMLPPEYRGKDKKGGNTSLNVLGTDGSTKRTLVWQCSQGAVPRMDRAGNIYIADMLKPPGRSYPEFFDGRLPAYKHDGAAIGGRMDKDPEAGARFWTSSMYGSIVKFPPSGGIIWYSPDLPGSVEGQPPPELLAKAKTTYGRHIGYNFKPVEVQGAEWVRFGFAPYGEARGAGFCMCEGVGFDVDDFGRVFYPNLGQFRIEVVDNANNWIGTFGRYGNADADPSTMKAGGSQSEIRNPKSAIPLAWPTYVAVSDDYAYVNDTLSNRVVRVKLGAAAEEVCAVK